MSRPQTYEAAQEHLNEALQDAIRGFAKWFAENWNGTREEWVKEMSDPPRSQDWFDGRKDGVESAEDAAEFYFGEFLS